MIPDGATIVIGGLIDNQLDNNWEGMPLLSRLPWLGYLFRHTDDGHDEDGTDRDPDAAHLAAGVSRRG